jgi:predicted CXXCH cytochrome family protein
MRLFPGLLAMTASVSAAPTFYKDVLPVLQHNCQSCHRPGQAAPTALLTYRDTRPWAAAIKQAVLARKMPPWFANAAYGHFANDRTLSKLDIDTVAAWVDAGAPAGNPKA